MGMDMSIRYVARVGEYLPEGTTGNIRYRTTFVYKGGKLLYDRSRKTDLNQYDVPVSDRVIYSDAECFYMMNWNIVTVYSCDEVIVVPDYVRVIIVMGDF